MVEAGSEFLVYINDIFFPIVDSETGDFRHLPFPGSIVDQPYMSMQILKIIQINYKKSINDKMEKLKNRR